MNVFQDKLLIPFGDKAATMMTRVWQPDESRATVFCIHGFEGNGGDFDYLGQILVRSGFTVVAPDIIGRGKSTYFRDPSMYTVRTSLRCLEALGRYAGKTNYFLGTSWGGALLMFFLKLARLQADKLILNDVGMESSAAVESLKMRLLDDSTKAFDTIEEAHAYVRESRSYLGKIPEELWGPYLANKVILHEGKYRLAYDPATTVKFSDPMAWQYDLFPLLEGLAAPTLLLYGTQSKCYDEARVAGLMQRHPRISCVPNLDGGHPPSLMTYDQALIVLGFLNAPVGAVH
jgi:pimeloyl-ACP methyl ester carboxylesterase